MKASISTALLAASKSGRYWPSLLTALDDLGEDVDGVAIPLVQAVVQRRVGRDVLDEQHGERADEFGGAVEPLGHPD